MGGAVDKAASSEYSISREGATSRSAPPRFYREVAVCLEARQLLLFIISLVHQGNNSCNYNAELK